MDPTNYHLRPNQEDILSYRRGLMGISAVPGSGKTWTLSLLAAQLLARHELADDQEILIVTLVNSAVDNFYQRIRQFLHQYHQFPFGFRVRTLHGLAHDIVRERPDLVGLDNNFQIIDEREAAIIRNEAAQSWIRANPNSLDRYFDSNIEDYRLRKIRGHDLIELIQGVALVFIRSAKNQQQKPDDLAEKVSREPIPLPLVEMNVEIYASYQRALMYRGAVDFDDLIRLAILALELDPELLERLHYRWPYILEDEAQDSSLLQEKILRKLVGPQGNWVRVGDPNQAIYETFTTANPKYLREFINQPEVLRKNLPHSGRSIQSIIDLANYLVQWTENEHPTVGARDALRSPPLIQPTPKGDPQPNPPDEPSQIHLVIKGYTHDNEIMMVVNSIEKWLPSHPDETVAVLVPRNSRADRVVDELNKRGIAYNDSLLRISSRTRSSVEKINTVLSYLADPLSSYKLGEVYKIAARDQDKDENTQRFSNYIADIIRGNSHVETYIWPRFEDRWIENIRDEISEQKIISELTDFRQLIRRWQESIILPIDQMILTFSQDLFSEASDLAIAQKIAALLKHTSDTHPEWRISNFVQEMDLIINNQRRLLGFNDDEMGFDPDNYKGIVVVATMHKAKGLEWDRVYLLSVNNYNFPGDLQEDPFISEKWFIRDRLNIQAETLSQLRSLLITNEHSWYEEGIATLNSRLDYIRERLRLLYVGITRAKKELIITWNTGKQKNLKPAIALESLHEHWLGQAHMEHT